MSKFEEMNKNSDSVFTNEIDQYLLSQGYDREKNVFCKRYYRDNFSTLVDISKRNIYFYRTDNGFYVSDENVEMDSSKTEDLESFKEFIDKVFEETYVI